MIDNDIEVECQIYVRCLKFFKSVISSDNTVVKVCGDLAPSGSDSTFCKNINYIWYKYNIKCSKFDIKSYLDAIKLVKSNYGVLKY